MSKIVLIDDDLFLLKLNAKRLENAGYNVVHVNDSTKAVEIIATEQPDLVLLDIVMPEKDGFIVLKELKATQKTKDIPVVVFSSLHQEEDISFLLTLGAAKYINKAEASVTDLISEVSELLGK